jgi:hypothetical protein
MIGTDAVIGRWDTTSASVSEYFISGRDRSNIVQADNQTLMSTSLTYENGNTVMRFIRPLAPVNNQLFVRVEFPVCFPILRFQCDRAVVHS